MRHIIAYEGVQVALAVMQEAYIETFVPWANSRNGIEGTLMRPPYTLASGIEWVRALDAKKGKDEHFAILAKTGDEREYEYIGHTGLNRIEWPSGSATTGTIIGADTGRGRGCGTEAKLLLQHHAFHRLGLRKLHSTVKGFNAASLGHLIKCGYTVVGRYKREIFHEGAFVDRIVLEVFREDWEPIWETYLRTKTLPRLTDEQRRLVQEQTT